jgi:S-adenosylmethionine hydrolase
MTIALLTDFGLAGPYLGQMKAVLAKHAPDVPIIDLFADLPAFDPRAAAYLLTAYCSAPFTEGTVFLCVVDPGVGTDRAPLVLWADGFWFVGPDNGLFALVVRRARQVSAWRIDWRPANLSNSFHGRDLFAPVAACLASRIDSEFVNGTPPPPPVACSSLDPITLDRPRWPDDLWKIVYIDHYGNAIVGARGQSLPPQTHLVAGQTVLRQGATFSSVKPGMPLHYVNSNGLVEVAVNGGSAAEFLCLKVGDSIHIQQEESG